MDLLVRWSPYTREEHLLQQFDHLDDQGTRIIIYNIWEDEGQLELDFDTDIHDIQIRGARDPNKIEMAKDYPNSRHFLTYRHSFRSYASILNLRIPDNFRIILRGKDVFHYNIVNDMMMSQKITYKTAQPAAADGQQEAFVSW
ncbi:protein microrchidia 7 [Tanacetum coccineum]